MRRKEKKAYCRREAKVEDPVAVLDASTIGHRRHRGARGRIASRPGNHRTTKRRPTEKWRNERMSRQRKRDSRRPERGPKADGDASPSRMESVSDCGGLRGAGGERTGDSSSGSARLFKQSIQVRPRTTRGTSKNLSFLVGRWSWKEEVVKRLCMDGKS